MSLLPNNETLQAQRFAVLIDKLATTDYSNLTNDPMLCDISVLQHIAVHKCANIDNMLEHEARIYLKTFNKKTIGTIGAVEDAISVYFSNGQIIEWFEDKEKLRIGQFSVLINVQNDKSIKYDERLFLNTAGLIKKSKNIRSEFAGFNIKYPRSIGNINTGGGSAINIKLKNKLDFSSHMKLNITGGVVWTV